MLFINAAILALLGCAVAAPAPSNNNNNNDDAIQELLAEFEETSCKFVSTYCIDAHLSQPS